MERFTEGQVVAVEDGTPTTHRSELTPAERLDAITYRSELTPADWLDVIIGRRSMAEFEHPTHEASYWTLEQYEEARLRGLVP